MQRTKFEPLFNLVAINKEVTRTLSVVASPDANLKSWKEIPGPSSLPVIGQLLNFIPGGQFDDLSQAEGKMKLFETYGPIVRFNRILSQEPMVFLFDPESAECILRSENSLPIRLGFQSLEHYRKVVKKRNENTFHITGLATEQGELWKEFRSTVNPVMLPPKTIKLYETVLDEVAQDMVKRMKSNRNEKNMITKDFGKEMNLWALESIGTVALGCRLNCFDPNLTANSPEWQLIECVHDLFFVAHELDLKPSLWKWFSTPMYKKAMKVYELQENLTKHFIQKGKEQLKNQSEKEKSILEKLLEINEDVAHIMASDMLAGGVDTMQIVFAHRDMCVLEQNFPKPREFIPERWLASKDDPLYYGNANPFAYQPFGFGVRSCIGRRIAELEMHTFVARVIENFQVEWFGPAPEIEQKALNYIKGPYNFVFKDAK